MCICAQAYLWMSVRVKHDILFFIQKVPEEEDELTEDVLHAQVSWSRTDKFIIFKKNQNVVSQPSKNWPGHKQIMELQNPPDVVSKEFLPWDKKRDAQFLPNKLTALIAEENTPVNKLSREFEQLFISL